MIVRCSERKLGDSAGLDQSTWDIEMGILLINLKPEISWLVIRVAQRFHKGAI